MSPPDRDLLRNVSKGKSVVTTESGWQGRCRCSLRRLSRRYIRTPLSARPSKTARRLAPLLCDHMIFNQSEGCPRRFIGARQSTRSTGMNCRRSTSRCRIGSSWPKDTLWRSRLSAGTLHRTSRGSRQHSICATAVSAWPALLRWGAASVSGPLRCSFPRSCFFPLPSRRSSDGWMTWGRLCPAQRRCFRKGLSSSRQQSVIVMAPIQGARPTG